MSGPLLHLRNIQKNFGDFEALRGASIALHPGRVTALLGENGAGKTTLMRIGAGLLKRDSGEIDVEGRSRRTWTSGDAGRAGVRMVEQHFALANQMSIAENLVLQSHRIPRVMSRRIILDLAAEMVDRGGLPLGALDRLVAEISVAERAKVELVKATSSQPRILILDEPTSVLGPQELQEIEALLRELKSRGTAIVIITHKLPEVFRLADQVAVMRRGEVIFEESIEKVSPESLARMMSETTMHSRSSAATSPAGQLCSLRGVQTEGRMSLSSVTLEVGGSEIVGIVGAAGNGQQELAGLLRGLLSFSGTVSLRGAPMTRETLFTARQTGHIPSDRIDEGLFGDLSILENLTVRAGSLSRSEKRDVAENVMRDFSIQARSLLQRVRTLSGGNQQKVLIARELIERPDLLVASEPTRGLDVQSAATVRAAMLDAVQKGTGILLISSDLEEILALADRVHVLYRGEMSRAFAPGQQDEIMRHIAGAQ